MTRRGNAHDERDRRRVPQEHADRDTEHRRRRLVSLILLHAEVPQPVKRER
jgi:hypothetical protein